MGQPQRGIVVVVVVVSSAVVVVAEGEGLLPGPELPEPRAREPPDGPLLGGHGGVALPEPAVHERVGLARGIVLLQQRVVALRGARGARLERVSLDASGLATENIELQSPRARLEDAGFLRGGLALRVREPVLGLLARRWALLLLLRHGRVPASPRRPECRSTETRKTECRRRTAAAVSDVKTGCLG